MIFNELLGSWIAVFLTLAIFSFLYKDNPFYKFAEHAFIGVSAGYGLSIGFWTIIQPNLNFMLPMHQVDCGTLQITVPLSIL